MASPLRVLLVEDNEGDAFLIRRSLKTPPANYEVVHAVSLVSALTLLSNDTGLAGILLDLNLGDSQGLDTLIEINELAPTIPIIVLTGVEDTDIAQNAVRHGAQDFLVKKEVTGGVLDRTIRLAWERKRKEHVRKQLTYESLNAIGMTRPNEDPALPMLRGHVKTMLSFLEELRFYFEKNAISHLEVLQLLEEQYGIEVVMRDLTSILRITGTTDRPKKISEHALSVVEEISAPAGTSNRMSEDEARQVVLETITRQEQGVRQ